jgi:hypothetical protein
MIMNYMVLCQLILIPLQYKYYTLEHYWPEDEKVSEIFS